MNHVLNCEALFSTEQTLFVHDNFYKSFFAFQRRHFQCKFGVTSRDHRPRGCTMGLDIIDLENMIDDLQASEQEQSNCMFQLSLMVARLALSPLSEIYKDEVSQALLEFVRAKRKSAPVVTFSRIGPDQRKPLIVDVHTSPVPQVPSTIPVSAKFGSGGLS